MTIEMWLDTIQNIRSTIEQWGVTSETLIAVALLATVMFIFSLREVLTWFMRIGPLKEEISSLRQEIVELKAMIATQSAVTQELVGLPPEQEDEKPVKAFRLDH